MPQIAEALEQREPNRELELCGERFVCDPFACLYWPENKTLIVSDLHLEKGSSYAVRGRFLPPFDTGATLNLLERQIRYWQPETVISLGDSFHDPQAAARIPDQYHRQLSAMMSGLDWIWIRGNHDPEAPANLEGLDALELTIGPITFRHEPSTSLQIPGEIAGHLHPAARIHRRGKRVRRRCFVGDGHRLILPSFGVFTGGLNIRDKAFDGLFDQTRLTAWLLGSRHVFEIDGRQLV